MVGLAHFGVWLGLTLVVASLLFAVSSRTVTLASHDAVVRPDLTGRVVLHTGPILPDFRIDSGSPVGASIRLGKTNVASTEALVERYAYIASQPEGQIDKVRSALVSMATDALVRGAILALVPVLLWALIGPARRRELARNALSRRGLLALLIVLLMVAGFWRPWLAEEERIEDEADWISLGEFLGTDVVLPEALEEVEVRGDATTAETRRIIVSAVGSYSKAQEFYEEAATDAAELELREPEEDETVVVLVSDRHDNIGMDAVARAIADAGGASAVFDAGDDTSSGKTWEAFSLDSLTAAFSDYDGRWVATGNHDHGDFVGNYLDERGWHVLDGEIVDGPDGSRLLGARDPRTSGLGAWRDEVGLSFDDVRNRLADEACAADEDGERVATVLVHDANLGEEALARGCVDLVLGGHLHLQVGPDPVVGTNGKTGYDFTTGTTGGAAYAIAIGGKVRRPAQVTLVTYADGRPIGLQGVVLQSNGTFVVTDFLALDYDD
ncbi:MAG: metallophosphoesterase [Nocardioides sp.]|nr:metallophosphoesterase [Nocardioides sp.]